MIENSILKKNKQGLKALVFALSFPVTEIVEYAARCGFDAISLDGEHGHFTSESVDLVVRVAHAHGMSVTARVPNIEPWVINLWLDRGIQGVLGPHIESGADALKLADACLFPTAGQRSWGGGRGTDFNEDAALEKIGGKLAFARFANENMIVSAQIESKRAYDNLDAILAVPGLDGIGGGPNDFAASLGHPGQPDHPERIRLTDDAEARARKAGKRVMSDHMSTLGLQELVLRDGREFVRQYRDAKLGA